MRTNLIDSILYLDFCKSLYEKIGNEAQEGVVVTASCRQYRRYQDVSGVIFKLYLLAQVQNFFPMSKLIEELKQILFSDLHFLIVLIDFLEKTDHFLKLKTLLKLLGLQHVELKEVKCSTVLDRVE